MNDQPDKLFRQKLENYQRPAPQDAWARIEKGSSKKNNKAIWLRIAASLLLMVVAYVAVKSILKKDEVDVITYESVESQPSKPDTQKAEEGTIRAEQKSPKPEQNLTVENKIANSHKVNEDHSKVTFKPREPEPVEESLREVESTPSLDVAEIISPLSTQEEIATTEDTKGFKLIIEADEVNQKYLNKGSLARATSREENPSGIKKLLDKAQDLKNNQDPIGDLRQMKNEIFALNFQENKKLEQNK